MRDILDLAIDISNITQDKASTTGKDYKESIEEKKMCLGVDQNNQGTEKNHQ